MSKKHQVELPIQSMTEAINSAEKGRLTRDGNLSRGLKHV